MTTRRPKSKSHSRWTAEHDTAVRRLADAAREAQHSATPDSQEQLRSAVDAARDMGIGWTKIGDTLGIASGNAYHRYRKRTDQQRCDANGAQG